jgi:hypothetical protein
MAVRRIFSTKLAHTVGARAVTKSVASQTHLMPSCDGWVLALKPVGEEQSVRRKEGGVKLEPHHQPPIIERLAPAAQSFNVTLSSSFQWFVYLSFPNGAVAMHVLFCTDVRDILAENARTFTLNTSLTSRHPAQGYRFELSWQMIFYRFGRPFANCLGSSRRLKS